MNIFIVAILIFAHVLGVTSADYLAEQRPDVPYWGTLACSAFVFLTVTLLINGLAKRWLGSNRE
jgi:hypothetical protein